MRGSLILYLKGMRRMDVPTFWLLLYIPSCSLRVLGQLSPQNTNSAHRGRYKSPYILHPSKPTLN